MAGGGKGGKAGPLVSIPFTLNRPLFLSKVKRAIATSPPLGWREVTLPFLIKSEGGVCLF